MYTVWFLFSKKQVIENSLYYRQQLMKDSWKKDKQGQGAAPVLKGNYLHKDFTPRKDKNLTGWQADEGKSD